MKLATAILVVLLGVVLAFNPVEDPVLTFAKRWEPVLQIQQPRELTFEERWEPVRQLPRMLNEERRLEPRIIPVRTFAIRREDIQPAVHVERVAEVAEPAPLPAARPAPLVRTIRKASLDICVRHGMHKQITRSGKSWRCRR